MRVAILAFTLVVSLFSFAAGYADAAPSALQPCTIPDAARPAECGSIRVRENRAVARGRHIDLYVVVVKARETGDAPPVLFFAGGPGQGAATLAAAIMADLGAVAPDRDVILIDQRGTGRSHLLTCDDGFLVLDRQRRDDFRRCRETLMRIADLSRYGTNESADDAAEVLRVLGHARRCSWRLLRHASRPAVHAAPRSDGEHRSATRGRPAGLQHSRRRRAVFA